MLGMDTITPNLEIMDARVTKFEYVIGTVPKMMMRCNERVSQLTIGYFFFGSFLKHL